MSGLRLIIFDVDGTLVDSQDSICAAMDLSYGKVGLECPDRASIRSIVGLSLNEAIARLSPEVDVATRAALVEGYKGAFAEIRARTGSNQHAPLYPGTREMLDQLAGDAGTVLALATGKSRRGVTKMIEAHGLEGMFQSQQTADTHPSKPHPSMIAACLDETGVRGARAVMVGDTTFDMDMGRAAGVATIGVGWGYHASETLAGRATQMIGTWAGLHGALKLIGLSESRS